MLTIRFFPEGAAFSDSDSVASPLGFSTTTFQVPSVSPVTTTEPEIKPSPLSAIFIFPSSFSPVSSFTTTAELSLVIFSMFTGISTGLFSAGFTFTISSVKEISGFTAFNIEKDIHSVTEASLPKKSYAKIR